MAFAASQWRAGSWFEVKKARSFDVVLYGATGFVGRQTVAYFAKQKHGLRWALAGRSASKLEALREACGAKAAGIIVADATDAIALEALAAQTKVVLSTAGPFALFGSGLVAACVAQRTHYVDITGETPWVRGLIDRHHAQAEREGTRIIPCCGFDSVPSDLGAWLVAQSIQRQYGEACVSVKACHSLRGSVNGGTLASALNLLDSGQNKMLANPFLLNPEGTAPRLKTAHADPLAPHHDADFNSWVGPFFMGPVNTRVVRRSAALMLLRGEPAYAADFAYQEYLRVGRGPVAAVAAAGLSVGMGLGQLAMAFKPWRSVAVPLARALVPGPGKGPSERAMDGGSFRCELVGRSASGKQVRGLIAGLGDPGNRATTVFVCESAMALALQSQEQLGGVLTPASALGNALAERLLAAGMTVEPLPG